MNQAYEVAPARATEKVRITDAMGGDRISIGHGPVVRVERRGVVDVPPSNINPPHNHGPREWIVPPVVEHGKDASA